MLAVLIPAGLALAQQPMAKPAAQTGTPLPALQFQQNARQQKVQSQWQQSQLEQQLRQGVSDNSRLPKAGNPAAVKVIDHAARAQRDRDRASQQALLDSYRDASRPIVVPPPVPVAAPAPARSGH